MVMSLDGTEVARGRIARTAYIAAGLGETFDTGRDTGEVVVKMPEGTEYNGKIDKIEFSRN
jgi:arylsulfatase